MQRAGFRQRDDESPDELGPPPAHMAGAGRAPGLAQRFQGVMPGAGPARTGMGPQRPGGARGILLGMRESMGIPRRRGPA